MRRYLVVANQTLAGDNLLSKLRELASHGPCAFHVLVPATPPRDHAWTEGEAYAIAEERLRNALKRFAVLGADVDGEVGDERVVQAVKDVLDRGGEFHAIVLSTLPPGISKWLRVDMPHRISGFGLPVIHVVGERENAAV